MLFRFQVPADGDCALTSIAHFLVLHKQTLPGSVYSADADVSRILAQESVEIKPLVNALRALAVARVREDEEIKKLLRTLFISAFVQYCATEQAIEFGSNTKDDIFCNVENITPAFRKLYVKYKEKLVEQLSSDKTFEHLNDVIVSNAENQLFLLEESLGEQISADLDRIWQLEGNGWDAFIRHISTSNYSLGDIEIAKLGSSLGLNVRVYELSDAEESQIPDESKSRVVTNIQVPSMSTVTLVHTACPAHWDLAVNEEELKKLNSLVPNKDLIRVGSAESLGDDGSVSASTDSSDDDIKETDFLLQRSDSPPPVADVPIAASNAITPSVSALHLPANVTQTVVPSAFVPQQLKLSDKLLQENQNFKNLNNGLGELVDGLKGDKRAKEKFEQAFDMAVRAYRGETTLSDFFKCQQKLLSSVKTRSAAMRRDEHNTSPSLANHIVGIR